MELTNQQMKSLDEGQPIPVVLEGRDCVIVPREVFDRVSLLLDFDPSQAYPAIDEAWREGWDDPKMADYDRYEEHRP
jgi:hypothetical protein